MSNPKWFIKINRQFCAGVLMSEQRAISFQENKAPNTTHYNLPRARWHTRLLGALVLASSLSAAQAKETPAATQNQAAMVSPHKIEQTTGGMKRDKPLDPLAALLACGVAVAAWMVLFRYANKWLKRVEASVPQGDVEPCKPPETVYKD